MKGRLYRFTGTDGKPSNCTDSLASASAKLGSVDEITALQRLPVGGLLGLGAGRGTWERIA